MTYLIFGLATIFLHVITMYCGTFFYDTNNDRVDTSKSPTTFKVISFVHQTSSIIFWLITIYIAVFQRSPYFLIGIAVALTVLLGMAGYKRRYINTTVTAENRKSDTKVSQLKIIVNLLRVFIILATPYLLQLIASLIS